ncbi:MAG TPA: hypothetical protein VF017_07790 [Thermoanaerobaculia bacterium]|nr:hypothetical protein [Thermoanaerobaculia bacterium]
MNAKPASYRALFTLAFLLAAAVPALADRDCRTIHSRVTLAASTEPGCPSDIGLCAGGVLKGSLRGTSEFLGTSFVSSEEIAAGGVIILTGDNTIHTQDGDLFTKDTIVLATSGAGEFGEVDTIVGGTGVWDGASGKLIGTGTFANGAGEALLVGEICWE